MEAKSKVRNYARELESCKPFDLKKMLIREEAMKADYQQVLRELEDKAFDDDDEH